MSARRMWSSLDMRVALARHDVGTVFRLMQRFGFSQRAIAALTGITQAEVSEIISGRRRVLAYSVLERSPTVSKFRVAGSASRSTMTAASYATAPPRQP
jgi:hypothetical protein